MGNKNTKSSLRSAIIYLNISADQIGVHDDKFWNQIFTEDSSIASEVVKSIRTQEIRMLRDGSPKNFATLIYKMVERLCLATGTLCNTSSQQTAVLNATRVLIRIVPCIFEDESWRTFFHDNFIGFDGEMRNEPKLVYSEKSVNEKNYTSYLPVNAEFACQDDNNTNDVKTNSDGDLQTSNHSESSNKRHGENTNLLMDDALESNDMVDKIDHLNLSGTLKNIDDEDEDMFNLDQMNQTQVKAAKKDDQVPSLMQTLITSLCDLLFCPEFTVPAHDYSYLSNTVDAPPEDLKSLSTCDYVWEPGVGFDSTINSTMYYDKNRAELLRLLLACLSETLYETPENSTRHSNKWIEYFVSHKNRHTLPLFTSFLNVVLLFKPSKPTIISNLVYEDNREELVELSVQILIAVLDYKLNDNETNIDKTDNEDAMTVDQRSVKSRSSAPISARKNKDTDNNMDVNIFIDYLTRIHRVEDLNFLVKGFSRLLGSRLEAQSGYILVSSRKQIEFDQELLILFWKLCSLNQKFVQHLLKSNEILDIVVPILYHLNENFQDASKTALIHIGVFNLLILSGERNFGVKLNKPYATNVLTNLPDFTGSHADLLIIVFHKLIMYGYDINQLYDYLLTIVANISPYLKGLTMLTSKCLIQLFEIFTSIYVIFTEPRYHSIAMFLLEIFNNIIQYQFDGNSNLVYTILNKRNIFLDLINMSTSQAHIDKALRRLTKQKQRTLEVEKTMMMASEEEKRAEQESKVNYKQITSNSDKLKSIDLRRNLATVSSLINSNYLKYSNKIATRQEVSLVATPDLCHVTLPIHPFDLAPSAIDIDQDNHQHITGEMLVPKNGDDLKMNSRQISVNQSSIETVFDFDEILGGQSSFKQVDDASQIQYDTGVLYSSNDKINPFMEHEQIGLTNSPTCANQTTSDNYNNNGKWKPTSKWLKQWKQSLPIHTVIRTIEVLIPQIEQFKQQQQQQHQSNNTLNETEIIKFLQSGTLVGLLPVPHPILIRKYRTNSGSTLWFRAYTWGVIYVRNSIWTDTQIRLIKAV